MKFSVVAFLKTCFLKKQSTVPVEVVTPPQVEAAQQTTQVTIPKQNLIPISALHNNPEHQSSGYEPQIIDDLVQALRKSDATKNNGLFSAPSDSKVLEEEWKSFLYGFDQRSSSILSYEGTDRVSILSAFLLRLLCAIIGGFIPATILYQEIEEMEEYEIVGEIVEALDHAPNAQLSVLYQVVNELLSRSSNLFTAEELGSLFVHAFFRIPSGSGGKQYKKKVKRAAIVVEVLINNITTIMAKAGVYNSI
ncbi:hypothetical protein HK097_003656 [Rhizophlyctis rosea]|uniref:Rho-GAP domain-containing protein n=1 Tax=Rhizophlyctis rosea TaxID=64517 RepID=A0AAD5X655_9FUNG|nr:hypothetical protein HK097_003656 [Rhizophlyctis rosea]